MNRVRIVPSRRTVLPLLDLWPAILLLSSAGIAPPGSRGNRLGTVPCPFQGCDEPARRIRGRQAGHCDHLDQRFLWSTCPQCGSAAFRTSPGSTWQCTGARQHTFMGHLCPRCWELGEEQTGENRGWYRCRKDRTWFYVAGRRCPSCHFGNLMTEKDMTELRCEACTRTRPARR